MRYLKGTGDLGILLTHNKKEVMGHMDADWAGSIDDRRSFTGFDFTICGGAILWDSRKQQTVALSTTEAEYMVLSEAGKEALHLSRFLKELGHLNLSIIKLYIDNFSVQKLATFPVFHSRTKHIHVRHHFVREVIKSGEIRLEHMSSEHMPADILTKALTKPKHQRCILSLGLEGSGASEVVPRGSVENSSMTNFDPTSSLRR